MGRPGSCTTPNEGKIFRILPSSALFAASAFGASGSCAGPLPRGFWARVTEPNANATMRARNIEGFPTEECNKPADSARSMELPNPNRTCRLPSTSWTRW
jgi:hypothetical protein